MFLGIFGVKYYLEEHLLTDWICFRHFAKRWISHVWYVFDKWSTRFGGWKGWVTYGFQKLVKLWNLDPTYVSWVQKTWLLTYNYKLCTTYNLTPNLHSALWATPRFKFRLNGNDRRLPLSSRKSCGLSENVLFDVLEIVVFEQNPNI